MEDYLAAARDWGVDWAETSRCYEKACSSAGASAKIDPCSEPLMQDPAFSCSGKPFAKPFLTQNVSPSSIEILVAMVAQPDQQAPAQLTDVFS